MNASFSLPIWVARCCGNRTNCVYPDSYTVTDVDTLKKLVSKDHTFICFRNNYRSEENFKHTDTLVVDCDNTHSDDPKDWVTKDDIIEEFTDVAMLLYTSRNHMKPKDGRAPRPKYHIIFFVDRITDPETYKRLVKQVQEVYPYFDTKAQDAARFFYGNPDAEVYVQPGIINLSMFFDEDGFAHMDQEIREGSRNATMFRWAVRSMKRYGNTEESRKCFYRQAERCVPPLEDSELETIWRSASKYYKRIASQPDYISPEVYNAKGPIRWEDPIPFSRYTMARFPIEALPKDIADYVTAVAESTQTPVDMAGAVSLSMLSVCLQGKYRVQGKQDWFEPLNTYVLAIAPPSERKSAVQHMMLKPINEYEFQYNQRNAALVESSRMQKRVLERRQKAIEDQVAKGKVEVEEMEKIAQEISEFREILPMQLYVDDITTEKLVSVISANHGRAALISSEGGIFDTLAGIYTKNVNIDVMLKGYSGDPIRVDRIGRESESIMNPALTILLMAQPNVISEVLNNTTFRGRGLTARFLYCMPVSFVGSRRFRSKPVTDEVYHRYERLVINLLEDEYPEKPETITLSDDAEKLLIAFAEEIEPKLVSDYAELADWAGKLIGNTLRIAGLLCRAGTYRSHEFLDVPEPLTVDGRTIANAIRLGRYFLNHAQAAYSVLPEDTMFKQASRILTMLKERRLQEFDRRAAMRYCRTFKTVAEIQPVLDFLDDYGYIARQPEKAVSPGRPPLPKYSVNPWVESSFCPFVTQLSEKV